MTIRNDPGNLVQAVDELVTAVNAGSGGGGGTVPIPSADATYNLDTTTYNNTISGSGKLSVAVFPADTTFLAVAIQGDAFPRLIMAVDPTDYASIMFGNGTADPRNGPAIGSNGDDLTINANTHIALTAQLNAGTVQFAALHTNSGVAATVLGTVVKRLQIFDDAGASLGFIPIYDSIT